MTNQTQPNTVYLVRHGENRANLTHEFSYKLVDYPLTPRGTLQARQTAEYFKDQGIDEIYASPLKRARETAEIIAEELKLPVTIRELFREINVGSLEGRPPTDENWALHNRIIQDWFEGKPDSAFPDGEDYHQLLQRLRAGLLDVTTGKAGKRIVIVAHGGIITRPLMDICPDLDVTTLLRHPNYNCAITQIELTTVDGQLQGVLKRWASYAHLHDDGLPITPGTSLIASAAVKEI